MFNFPFRRLAIDCMYTQVLNLVCGLITTYVFKFSGGFLSNWLISACIGTIALLLIDGARLAMWGEGARPHWFKFLLVVAVSVPLAQVLGMRLGGWLMGYPVADMGPLDDGTSAGLMVFTLLAAGAATVFFAGRDRALRAEAALAVERARTETVARQALQAQLQSLQAQIEPHMLFNTLANLQGLIAIDPPRAQDMLEQLIQYLRATLTSSRAESTTLAQEFALMDAYLGLMRIRMGERLSYALDLPAGLRGLAVPPMLLQPLVENAIAHGLEPKIEGGHLAVGACLRDGLLALTVQDSGRGLDAEPGKAGTSVGLANTRERLQAIYGGRAALTLEAAAPHGAIARITLPA
ncbi:histidine kinase [Pseudoduganella sp. LjRoot289]|uniref:sensor histidine kinase n=1 Tax=Pseudoduganella sp. LjRoot289 TaxID=3342314 RepID=UPI003ED0911C